VESQLAKQKIFHFSFVIGGFNFEVQLLINGFGFGLLPQSG
jgi:hypothetical protein